MRVVFVPSLRFSRLSAMPAPSLVVGYQTPASRRRIGMPVSASAKDAHALPPPLVILENVDGDVVVGGPSGPVREGEQCTVPVKGLNVDDGGVSNRHADPVSGFQLVNTFEGHARPSASTNRCRSNSGSGPAHGVDDSLGKDADATPAPRATQKRNLSGLFLAVGQADSASLPDSGVHEIAVDPKRPVLFRRSDLTEDLLAEHRPDANERLPPLLRRQPRSPRNRGRHSRRGSRP